MFRVAIRSITARRWRLVSTAVAVIVGVSFIVGTSVLGTTLKGAVSGLIDETYQNIDAVVRNPGDEEYRRPLDLTLLGRVKDVSGVEGASGVVASPIQVASADGEALTSVTSLPTLLTAFTDVAKLQPRSLVDGQWPSGDNEAVIDKSLADAGSLSIGDSITVAAQTETVELTIVGLSGLPSGDSGATEQYVTVLTDVAQALSGITGSVDRIDVIAEGGIAQDALVASIQAKLPKTVEVISGDAFLAEQQGEAVDAVNIIEQAVGVFGWVALFVAVFVIQNTFAILVAQRMRELALLRAVGASRGQIISSILIEAATIGIVAGLLGVAIGYGLAIVPIKLIGGLVPIGTNPTLDVSTAVFGVGLAALTTILSALWPAIRASRIPPVAAMSAAPIDNSHLSMSRVLVGAITALAGVTAILIGRFANDFGDPMRWVGIGAALSLLGVIIGGPALVRPFMTGLGRIIRRVSPVSGRVGVANATRSPQRTAATAAALLIGITVVTVTAMFATAIRASFGDAFSSRLAGDLVVDSGVPGLGGLNPEIAARVKAVPGVGSSSPVRFAPTKVPGYEDLGGRAITLGVDSSQFFDLVTVGEITGDVSKMGPDDIAVPSTFAAARGWKLGDTVVLDLLGTGDVPLKIVAITEKPVFLDQTLVIDIKAFDRHVVPILHFDAYLYVGLEDGAKLEDVRELITTAVADQPTAKVLTPAEFAGVRVQRLDAALSLIFALLGLAVLVAAVGIWNTLQLSIVERRRELALTRAVGATRTQIRRMIAWEASAISLLGTGLGLAIGTAVGKALLDVLPGIKLSASLPATSLGYIALGGLLSGVLAAAIPARRAARSPVLDGLRTE